MEARCDAAVTYRNTRVSRHRDCRGNARNDLKFYAGSDKLQGFFAAAPEHERVTALEARNHATGKFTGELHQQLVDFGLFDLVVRRHLAHIDHLGFRIAESENRGRNETVIDHHVGLLNDFLAAERQEPRVTRTRTDQIDFSKTAHP